MMKMKKIEIDKEGKDENWSGIKGGVIDEEKTDGKMIAVLAYIGV